MIFHAKQDLIQIYVSSFWIVKPPACIHAYTLQLT